jgi:hypothetical protein
MMLKLKQDHEFQMAELQMRTTGTCTPHMPLNLLTGMGPASTSTGSGLPQHMFGGSSTFGGGSGSNFDFSLS